MHIGLLSKRHLHYVASRLNMIPFLRYQTPFVVRDFDMASPEWFWTH